MLVIIYSVYRAFAIKIILYDAWHEGLCARLNAYEEEEYFHAFPNSVLGRQQTSALHSGRFTPYVMCLKDNLVRETDIMNLTLEINHDMVHVSPSV